MAFDAQQKQKDKVIDSAYRRTNKEIGTSIAKRGEINEMRMAQIVAVTRLGMPRSVMGNCTHEPCTPGAIAGANLFWAEVGANPRDIEEKTEEGRGETVSSCKSIFQESNWDIWSGPLRCYNDLKKGSHHKS